MHRIINIIVISSLFFLSACDKKKPKISTSQGLPLFQQIDPSQSNITFANNVKVDLAKSESLFDYDYFYNVAGLGIADLNNDGLPDIFFGGNQVPNKLYLNKLECSSEQVPVLTEKFPTYKSFANASIEDGFEDLILAGNIYNTKVETPRLDSGNGLLLEADGQGWYNVIPNMKFGLDLSGNVKSLKLLTSSKTHAGLLIAGVNNAELKVFEQEINKHLNELSNF